MLAVLLAVTMLPASGLLSANADEPAPRPATSGGDVALESTNDENAETESRAPIAEEREDGMLAADGLLYTVADGGLSLVGFDGAAPEGALTVPPAISVEGKDTPVVAISIAEGQTADQAAVLSLSQSVKDIDTASLALAFPNLRSVEAAGAAGASLPAASGASSMRAVYSTSGGMLFRPTSVTFQNEDGSIETIECRELVWAPPALVSARIPVDCRAVAAGAFADVRELQTVVCFGIMERIADGAFSTGQMEAAKVVIPASSPAVADEGAGRVSASMALMGSAGQKERRYAWHEAGWRTDDIVMGKPYGSLTETVAVTDEGALASEEAQLISYPDMHPQAMDVKHPGEDGKIDMADNGLAFTVKSDMTASVAWRGDPTATPAHVDIPASVVIDGVTYPVTEVAPNAFKGAVFLTSVAVPEGIVTIGEGAFEDCASLSVLDAPASLREIGVTALEGTNVRLSWVPTSEDVGANEDKREAVDIPAGEGDLLPTQETIMSVEGNDAVNGAIEELAREATGAQPEGEAAIISSDGLQSDDESISTYTSTTGSFKLFSYPLNLAAYSISLEGARLGIQESDRVWPGTVGGMAFVEGGASWTSFVNSSGGAVFRLFESGTRNVLAEIQVKAPTGYVILAAGVYGVSQLGWKNNASEYLWVTAGRSQVMGSSPLLTEEAAAATYQKKGDYALSSHTHAAGDITSGTLSTDRIPNLNASKVTSGTFGADRIPNLDAGKITSGTFGTNRLTDAAVTVDKIKDAAVTTNKIKDLNVTEGKLAADAVTTAKIKNLNVTADKLAADAVTEGKIKDAAVTTNKIKDLNVTEKKLAADAVTTNKIADANVTEKKLATDAVTTDKIKNLNVTTEKLANAAVTNEKIADGTIADDKLASTFVKPTEFGSVRYESVYDAETNTYPTMYRRGGTPAVHEPHREGYEFLGWEWQRSGSSPASGSGELAPAFAEAGEVTLRATWKEVIPEANHFFTTDVPLKAEDNAERQSHVVAVRLADFERSLRRVAFERNDATGLLREGAEIELWVGNTPDVIGTGTRLALGETDEAWLPSMPLAQIGDASWGVYVGVRIRTADVDASRLVASYASGAYVVSLVKMSYEFA